MDEPEDALEFLPAQLPPRQKWDGASRLVVMGGSPSPCGSPFPVGACFTTTGGIVGHPSFEGVIALARLLNTP